MHSFVLTGVDKQPDLERLTPYVKELSRKQHVTAQSLEKIEDGKTVCLLKVSVWTEQIFTAAYAIVVRGSEYELSPERLDDIVAMSVSTFAADDRRHRGRSANDDDV